MAIKDEVFQPNVGLRFSQQGIDFCLWAPFAKSVALAGDFNGWQEEPMNGQDGYWRRRVESAVPGQTYQYVLITEQDEKLYRVDPRSLQVTGSEEGTSVIPDPKFDWQGDHYTAPPKEQLVLYELHVGTFGGADRATIGTFAEAILHLDHLERLGVTTVELMPVTSMNKGFGWGYTPNLPFAVENSYGGRQGLKEFVRACHARGIGVFLDLVYNHFNGDYLWKFDGWSENDGGGIYFYNDDRGGTPWDGARPDYGRPEVRQYILDNLRMWFEEFHIDGVRIDSTTFMRNRHGYNDEPGGDIAEAWSLLGSITELAHQLNPAALVIAEDHGCNEYLTRPVAEGGCGFDAQWELSLPQALRGILQRADGAMDELNRSLFLRFIGAALHKVVFADSHDPAANGDERLVEEIHPSQSDLVAAEQISILIAAVALTTPGIPMLLQGQAFLQPGSFNAWQHLDWSRAEQFGGLILANQHLIALRRNLYGDTAGLGGEGLSLFHRNDDNLVLGWTRGEVLVLVNFSGQAIGNYQLRLPEAREYAVRFNSSWSGYCADFTEVTLEQLSPDEEQNVRLELPAYGVVVATAGE